MAMVHRNDIDRNNKATTPSEQGEPWPCIATTLTATKSASRVVGHPTHF
jgi:hypothetical protein